MAGFSADLLERPAVQGACLVAQAHLADAALAAARLEVHSDTEALHDFRVAMRRLRVTVRAYPGLHESISRKQARRARKLVRATNPARDAEVQIAWFRDRSSQFTPSQRTALGPFRARLRARRRRERARALLRVQRRFSKLERKLRHRLGAMESAAGAHEAPFRAVAAAALIEVAAELRDRLAAVTSASDATETHAARIAAKRVRYLLEPVAGGVPMGATLLRLLKSLQDILGELTDAHVLESELERAAAGGGMDVTAAAALLGAEIAARFAKLSKDWLSSDAKASAHLQDLIADAARRLQSADRARRGRLGRSLFGGNLAARRPLRSPPHARRR